MLLLAQLLIFLSYWQFHKSLGKVVRCCRNLVDTEALDAVTSYLDLGVYSEWDEEKKLDFLTRELKGKRPLVPPNIEVSTSLHNLVESYR